MVDGMMVYGIMVDWYKGTGIMVLGTMDNSRGIWIKCRIMNYQTISDVRSSL
jgi:hypothetical protein